MWRSFLAVLLLPSLLCAQQPVVQQEMPLSVGTFQPSYQTFTQRESLRRGTREKAAMVLILGNDSVVSVVSPRDQGAKVIPLRLAFDNSEGITATDVLFSPDEKTRNELESSDIRLLTPNRDSSFQSEGVAGCSLGRTRVEWQTDVSAGAR